MGRVGKVVGGRGVGRGRRGRGARSYPTGDDSLPLQLYWRHGGNARQKGQFLSDDDQQMQRNGPKRLFTSQKNVQKIRMGKI